MKGQFHMNNSILRLTLPVFLCAAGVSAEPMILSSPGKTMGVSAIPASENRWVTQMIGPTRDHGDADIVVSGEDFFRSEYGKELDFSKHTPSEFDSVVEGGSVLRNGALEFKTPESGWSILFGAAPVEDPVRSCIKFGRTWGKHAAESYRLEMDVEQNVPKTEWSFERWREGGAETTPFTVDGSGRQTVRIPLGMISPIPYTIGGIRILCRTAGAEVKIRSMRIVPFTVNIFYRRKFRLDFEPVRAGISFPYKSGNHELSVNGRKADEGAHIMTGGIVRKDLTGFLRKGENEILFRDPFLAGYERSPSFAQETFAIGRNGERELLTCDTGWEWSYDGKNWSPARTLGRYGFEYMPNKTEIANGDFPLHTGILKAVPRGEDYPVFDYDGDVSYLVSVPAGVENPEIRMTLREAPGGEKVETLVEKNGRVNGNFREFVMSPKVRKVGAYRVEWSVLSNGKELDSDRGEMLICGPIPQDGFILPEFEKELEKRLRPVQVIDCAKEGGAGEFMDHSGWFGSPRMNIGRVVEKNGMRYRETGENDGDVFLYKLHLERLGEPMIAEIEFPDNEERILYSAVNESYPVLFCCNGWGGRRGWPNATGSVMTGGIHPLSMEKRTLRYVFFPGSKNLTISVENGKTGLRAAASKITIYAVDGGLPALKIPETKRLYGNHNERPLFMNWGSFVSPRIQVIDRDYFENAWTAAFYGIANRIRFLRFAGHNASVEGAYMYVGGVPMADGNSENIWDGFDYFYAMLKMYKHNGIKPLIGFEYTVSPKLKVENAFDVSDAEVRSGAKRTPHVVDRYGKQVVNSNGGSGLNYLNPTVRDSVRLVMENLYRKYGRIGGVEGVYIINGFWWMPGLCNIRGFLGDGYPTENVSYDDDTIEQFQKDTGIHLDSAASGAERFAKRYELLNGKYASEWAAWRSKAMRGALEDLGKIVSAGAEKWKVYTVPVAHVLPSGPFDRIDATREERDSMIEKTLRSDAFDPAFYGRGADTPVQLIPTLAYGRSQEMKYFGIYTNRGTREVLKKANGLYLAPIGLNERGVQLQAADKWWWEANAVSVYDLKPAGDYAMADIVDATSEFVPRNLFHTWLDVNSTTGHTEQERRFLAGFYATPELDFVPFPGVRGAGARTAGNYVRIVNDTPYPVKGTLSAGVDAEDLVNGTTFTGTREYEIRPFAVLVFRTENPEKTFTGKFSFPEDIRELVLSQAKTILSTRNLRKKLPADLTALLRRGVAENDIYLLCSTMRDFEVFRIAKRFFDSVPYLKNQNRLLELLKETGSVRIDCGSTAECVDSEGRLWLPDQPYTGFSAYGNEYAIFTNRGPVEIRNTSIPEIYRTEAGSSGNLYYHIPLPDGVYTVKLHFAVTWDQASPNHTMRITAGGKEKSVRVWDLCGGLRSAGIETLEDVTVKDGLLSIELQPSSILNGIEILKKGN